MNYRSLGAIAYRAGKPAKANPYAKGTDRYKQWRAGHQRARFTDDPREVVDAMERFNRRSASQITHDAAGVAAVLEDVA